MRPLSDLNILPVLLEPYKFPVGAKGGCLFIFERSPELFRPWQLVTDCCGQKKVTDQPAGPVAQLGLRSSQLIVCVCYASFALVALFRSPFWLEGSWFFFSGTFTDVGTVPRALKTVDEPR